MAAFFASASSQYLSNAASPITGYPYTIGIWVYPTTTAASKDFVGISDTGTTNNLASIRQNASDQWSFISQAGGAAVTANGGTVTANQWAFFIGRGIAAANRRLDVLQFDGSTAHAQNTSSQTPTGIDTMIIGGRLTSAGASNFFDGRIGEFWYTNTDIQPDGASLNDDVLRQLARFGPFSVPSIAKDVLEYRNLFQALGNPTDNPMDCYSRIGRQVWTNTGGVIGGGHPPLIGYLRNTRRMGGMKIV